MLGPDGTTSTANAISLVDDVSCYIFMWRLSADLSIYWQREHLAALVGIHPAFKYFCKLIPDPFFINGRKSTAALINLARRRVTHRLQSGGHRDDILNKMIPSHAKEGGSLTPEELTDLIAETVTLLWVKICSSVNHTESMWFYPQVLLDLTRRLLQLLLLSTFSWLIRVCTRSSWRN